MLDSLQPHEKQAASLSAVSRDVFKDSGRIEMYGDGEF